MDTQKQAQSSLQSILGNNPPFPVVGIGASAGGLPALATLLENMPPSPGMALVVILHLSSTYPSAADKVLQRATDMPVVQVDYRVRILPNQVYVIPPGVNLTMEDSHLVVNELHRPHGDPVTIDVFFRTLAQAHKEHAIGVVLSGMGRDGTSGLLSIKEQGGVAIVQVPTDAEEGSMPQSAIESGMADFVLTAAQIPQKLVELRDISQAIYRRATRRESSATAVPLDLGTDPQETLEEVLATLQARTGHDFRQYKQATLLRRLERRLQVRGVRDLALYTQLLNKDHIESQALLKDLLIGVTSFFRDKTAFDAVERMVLPDIYSRKGPEDQVRAWVSACSTGEEAYSLSMLLADLAAARPSPPALQVFATDIDERAVQTARAGLYPESIASDVPPDRLERYFTRNGDRYKVRKTLRDRILFAPHNLLHNPAFLRLDLISCRNFLIYLNREMHRRVLEMFHFALNPGGYLFLGSAESVEFASHLFEPADAHHRLYRARPPARRTLLAPVVPNAPAHAIAPVERNDAAPARQRGRMFSFAEIHRQKLAELGPPSILVNASLEVVHVGEQAGRYLHHTGGEPSRDILLLVSPDLRLELRTALFQAQKSGKPASSGPVRHEREGGTRLVEISVHPFHDAHAEGELILVQFNETAETVHAPAGYRDASLLHQLDEELQHTRQKLQETIEQAEMSGAATRTSIEELQAMAEELRSYNEELEVGREEVQSFNEELKAVNTQLKFRVEESAKAHDDLSNLIASAEVATIFLDPGMCIERYTPRIASIFNIIPTDVGRPLTHITNRLDDPELAEEAAKVFDTLQPMEREVRSIDGRYYVVRVHPYRTTEDRIDGAVMTFFDITSRRAAEEALHDSEARLAKELSGARLLHKLSTMLIPQQRPKVLHEEILDAALELMAADAASIQLLDAASGRLSLLASRHLHPASQAFWQQVDAHSTSTCGLSLRSNARVVVEDVEAEPALAGTRDLEELRRSGLRAVQSTPLVSRLGRCIGVVSTHWHMPHRLSEDDLNLFDILARQLADLIERSQADAALRESEERFRALVEGFAQSVWEADAHGAVMNDAPIWLAGNGPMPDEWRGTGWTDAIHPDDLDNALRQWQEALEARRAVNAEFRLRTQGGEWRWTNVRAAPILNADGTIHKWVGMNIDISARKEVETALHLNTERFCKIIR